MSKFFERLVCIILAIMSGFTFMANGLKVFAASSFSSSPVYGLLAEGTVDSILGELKEITCADDITSAVYNPYGTILDYAQDALELQESSRLLVDKNSYNSTLGFWNIAYGVLATGELVRVMYEAGEYIYDFVSSALDVEISGETFADICNRLAEQYAPDPRNEYISWATDKRFADSILSEDDRYIGYRMYRMSFYADGYFCGNSDWLTDVYLVPFYYDGSKYYYGGYQMHINQYTNTADDGTLSILWDCTTTSYFDSTFNSSFTSSVDHTTHRYAEIAIGAKDAWNTNYHDNLNGRVHIGHYDSYDAYVQSPKRTLPASYYISGTSEFGGTESFARVYDSSDSTVYIDTATWGVQFYDTLVADAGGKDYGFICSNEPIEMQIIEPIPSEKLTGTTVTISGDTIYDYTITNAAGDTSTVNYFVNNNYTYENIYTETDTDSGSTGGSASGDVTVSGNIDVSGSVDININVEQGSGSTGEVSPYEYEEVNLGEALEQIPKMSDGFTSWFQQVFAWLPPELMGLLIGGLALAILLRIAGR